MAETAYFKKIVLSTEIRLSNDKAIPWVPTGWNVGVLETTDPMVISELDAFAKREVGGITRITKEVHDDEKKNSVNKSPKQE